MWSSNKVTTSRWPGSAEPAQHSAKRCFTRLRASPPFPPTVTPTGGGRDGSRYIRHRPPGNPKPTAGHAIEAALDGSLVCTFSALQLFTFSVRQFWRFFNGWMEGTRWCIGIAGRGASQWSERFLGITDWDPSVCKSNRLHVHIVQFSFIKFGVYSIYSSKMTGDFLAILNFNRLFLKLDRFICN